MTQSLIPEKPMTFSPSLAASIGLEEAIMLQHLQERRSFQAPNEQTRGLHLSVALLHQALHFWNHTAIARVLRNLQEMGIISLNSHLQNADEAFILLIQDNPRSETAPQANVEQQTNIAQSTSGQRMRSDWFPSEHVITQLKQHGITNDFIAAQTEEFIMYWQERGEACHSWSSRFLRHVVRLWRDEQARQVAARKQAPQISQSNDWQPSEDAIEILTRMGIPGDFIEDAVAEFVLYWRERGDAHNTWNSKFVSHVKRQWARYTHSLHNDTEPRAISANWQPDQDVFDVLDIANIDHAFARSLIPEFILFWRDSNQLHHSWNTKFLQHVKYHWAKVHNLNNKGNPHEKNQSVIGQRSTKARSISEDLTDRSWAY